jgi:hypothetical protein
MKVPNTIGLNFTTNNFITCLAVGLLAGMQFPNLNAQAEVDFSSDIQPVLNEHCTSCHGGVKQAGNVSFLAQGGLLKPAKSGEIPLIPGNASASEIIRRIRTSDPDDRMPPPEEGPGLDLATIETFETWINEGAPWNTHWAYKAPERHTPPETNHALWSKQPIDAFILNRLEEKGWHPSQPAPRAIWLRRVSLDLTGLPPTPDEILTFENNPSPTAYEQEVERLLKSPRYGERWASMWLDLARYADTQGYEKDLGRNVWPWRDWVIRSFNEDMPYDQFLIKQLAGDLLPDRTLEDLLATTYHRNTQTNTEGGTDDEEFRMAAVIDRLSTTWEAFQGTSFRCVQCHSHPYDPFSHDEFYKFLAFFNTSEDADVTEDFPLVKIPSELDQLAKVNSLYDTSQSIRQTLFQEGMKRLDEGSQWKPISAIKASSSGETQLVVTQEDGHPEVRAQGNLSTGSKYEIVFEIPDGMTRLEALKIEVLPNNPTAALSIPEMGFVLSRFKLWVNAPGTEPDPEDQSGIPFKWVVDDDPAAFYDATDSLKDGGNGWGAYTRLNAPRTAALIPEQPIDLPASGSIRISMLFQQSATGAIPLLIRRARFAMSESDMWSAWAGSDGFQSLVENLGTTEHELSQVKGVNVPVMLEQPKGQKRTTEIFLRGNWLDRGATVEPGVPLTLHPLNQEDTPDRLAMAQWLASKQNPLTALVLVNRIWANLFGTGIVATVEEFGSTGSPPTHPKLLDDLSARFMEHMEWRLKPLLRELVLSATYRQAAQATPELLEKDPGNRWLTRGPRTRLTAEMIRDQALMVSGLLSPKMHGPPVMPPQPEGVWRTVYNSASWKTAEGEDRYRRGLYTYCRRTSGYPSFLAFDAPTREVCTSRRVPTNTPLQALVTLNDPVYMECAQALAKRMRQDESSFNADIAIRNGMRLVTGVRQTDDDALQPLHELYQETIAYYGDHPELATDLGDNAAQSALVIVANALLNLDMILTK